MLTVKDLESGYGPMQVLWKPSLHAKRSAITALLGPNGVGKSTFLTTVFGAIKPWGGAITYAEKDVTSMPTHKKVEMGMALVPEGKHLFADMSVHENLAMGAYVKKALEKKEESRKLVYSLFPLLKVRNKQLAGSLSGGEQQMLTIARALMTNPLLLLMDEPSEGLAPIIVQEIGRIIKDLKESGFSILLVEQNLPMALGAAGFAYIISKGLIVYQSPSGQLMGDADAKARYLGVTG